MHLLSRMALGNSLGGIVIDHLGLNAMLVLAVCIAVIGTTLVNLTIGKRDSLT